MPQGHYGAAGRCGGAGMLEEGCEWNFSRSKTAEDPKPCHPPRRASSRDRKPHRPPRQPCPKDPKPRHPPRRPSPEDPKPRRPPRARGGRPQLRSRRLPNAPPADRNPHRPPQMRPRSWGTMGFSVPPPSSKTKTPASSTEFSLKPWRRRAFRSCRCPRGPRTPPHPPKQTPNRGQGAYSDPAPKLEDPKPRFVPGLRGDSVDEAAMLVLGLLKIGLALDQPLLFIGKSTNYGSWLTWPLMSLSSSAIAVVFEDPGSGFPSGRA